jgi:hypothetical protein
MLNDVITKRMTRPWSGNIATECLLEMPQMCVLLIVTVKRQNKWNHQNVRRRM